MQGETSDRILRGRQYGWESRWETENVSQGNRIMKLDAKAGSPSHLAKIVQTMEGISRLTHLSALPEKDQRLAVDSGTTWTSAELWFPIKKKNDYSGKKFPNISSYLKNKTHYLK